MTDVLRLFCRRTVADDVEQPLTVTVAGGRVVELHPDQHPDAIDLGDAVLMPGLVDAHVHINEPGRTEWEGFVTATKAAAAGGVTTLVDMPLNCTPVTTTEAAVHIKRKEASRSLSVDVALWGGVVPEHVGEIAGMARAGIRGAKAFMCHSGIDDFPASDTATLRAAMLELKRTELPLLVHAELEGPTDATEHGPTDYSHFLASRPASWEERAIERIIGLCRETGCAVHIVHLSAASALDMIRAAKDEGLPLTVETCPHYLCLRAEEVPAGATVFKCCPPIREEANRLSLWAALREGLIDVVVSDHSPCTPHLKVPERGDFMDAWGGISGLQLGLSSVWTVGRDQGVDLCQIAQWMSQAPAALAGLERSKGRIAVGMDADFVVFEPDVEWVVDAKDLFHRHKISPYVGAGRVGRVVSTWLRGRRVFHRGEHQGACTGRLL